MQNEQERTRGRGGSKTGSFERTYFLNDSYVANGFTAVTAKNSSMEKYFDFFLYPILSISHEFISVKIQ